MDSSFLSLLIFVVITILYYLVLKPKLNASAYDDLTGEQYASYSGKNNVALVIYFLLIMSIPIIFFQDY
jgi:hypothetical protein